MLGGVHNPWIGSPAVITPGLLVLTPGFFQPGAVAVDAFTQDCEHESNLLLPPVSLIVRTINHLKQYRAEGSIVVPVWKSSYF